MANIWTWIRHHVAAAARSPSAAVRMSCPCVCTPNSPSLHRTRGLTDLAPCSRTDIYAAEAKKWCRRLLVACRYCSASPRLASWGQLDCGADVQEDGHDMQGRACATWLVEWSSSLAPNTNVSSILQARLLLMAFQLEWGLSETESGKGETLCGAAEVHVRIGRHVKPPLMVLGGGGGSRYTGDVNGMVS